jgi:amidohydrolase
MDTETVEGTRNAAQVAAHDAAHLAVQKHCAAAAALSDDLAAHPELSNEEFESSGKIAALLEQAGYAVEYPFAGHPTAFKGVMENGNGADVAILVEYDALPGVGHGCGHNLHGSLSVLTALALTELKDTFSGTISVIGTPAEETDGGKIAMAEKGVFDGFAAALMMHSTGGGICQPDMDALSLRNVILVFKGRAAHAVASPWKGASALAAARKCLDLIDARRECFTPDVHVNAIMVDAGRAPNIIPERAELHVEFRTDSMGRLTLIDDIILKCAKGAALAMDCEVTWDYPSPDFADMIRIPALETEAARIMRSLGLTVTEVDPPLGSTDVGNVSYHCPAVQPLIAITKENFALHTADFAAETQKAAAHAAMALGAETLVTLALRLLNDEGFRGAVHAEFVKRRDAKLGQFRI